ESGIAVAYRALASGLEEVRGQSALICTLLAASERLTRSELPVELLIAEFIEDTSSARAWVDRALILDIAL
ncbi:hypothetical protein, partial [Streptomyces sp. P17]|uniref:hypothetical protein n=1 Tax=Streptomyces sp. P17 TaxID=3074716 RepID=UPI0028F42CB9